MSEARIPPNEDARLEALHRYSILDTLPEPQYDDLTFLASQLSGTPISLISLIDKDRQWFKSRVGIDIEFTERKHAFCAHAILGDSLLQVPDAREDPRFRDNPLVTGEDGVRFYAGAPLITPDGFPLGTLCVLDKVPREMTAQQTQSLEALARQVVAHLELWRTVKRLEIADSGRQQALSQLSANSAILRQFVEHAPAAIAMLDEEMRYIAVSRRFMADFGMVGQDILGLTHYEVFHNIPESWKAVHRRCLAGAVESCEQDEYIRVDGTHDYLRWEVRPWRRAGGEVGGIIMLIEITTGKVKAERIKNEFLSVVSHELRTPLTSIRGALGLLDGGVMGHIPEAAHGMLEIAKKNSERLLFLINDILDMEKIENGKLSLNAVPLDLFQLVRTSVEANQGYAQSCGVRLSLQGQQVVEENSMVLGDESRLMQVMANLISNACKFAPDGTAVEVVVSAIRFVPENSTPGNPAAHEEQELSKHPGQGEGALHDRTVDQWEPGLRVSVIDNGPGVPQEFAHRLFEKFAQADATTTRQKNGTGLGLAISSAIIKRLGGNIGYAGPQSQSEPAGSAFFLELAVYRDTPNTA